MNKPFDKNNVVWNGKPVTAHDGLLWCGGEVILVPEADRLAEKYGFVYAERLVEAMGGNKHRGNNKI